MTEIEISRAVDTGNLAEVDRLLAAGANPNGGFRLFPNLQPTESLLHTAARLRNLEIINSLLQAGADPNLPSSWSGATPFMVALGPNLGRRLIRYDIVERLLEAGADPNLLDRRGRSALFYAADNEFHEAIEKLLPQTNTVNLKNVYDMARDGYFFPQTNRMIIDYYNQVKNRRSFEIAAQLGPIPGPKTEQGATNLGPFKTHENVWTYVLGPMIGPKAPNGGRRRKTRVVKRAKRRARTHKRRA